MGVKNLWDVLDSCKKTLPLNHLENKRICIDLSCWIVQLVTSTKSSPLCMKDKVYLRGFFHRLRALIALNCSLILVSDGSIPAIKIPTYMRRLNTTSEINKGVPVSEKVSLKRSKSSEFSCMIKEAKMLGLSLGIPSLDGIEEAEAQCALLNSEGLCDGCFSIDSDIFLFGGRTVYRDICLGDGGYIVCYEMSDIERQLGLGRNSLLLAEQLNQITLALFFGSDYSEGVPRVNRKLVCEAVKLIGDREILRKVESEGLSFVKKTKRSNKSAQNLNKNKENTTLHDINIDGMCDLENSMLLMSCDNEGSFPEQKVIVRTLTTQYISTEYSHLDVIDAFLMPKCHPADSDDVYRVLVQHPFQHVKFQQVCGQYFQWPTEVTDDYILPKIAERELRRFNNLRSTSSVLGVDLPLDEMPIMCPVSKIIKQRSVKGKSCFEVSWNVDLHGLKTSIVPADLIQSACPEKIAEFEEDKAQKKKQNHRKPKVKKTEESLMSDIDQRLQNLFLGIEHESTSITSPDSSSPSMLPENGNIISLDTLIETTSVFVGEESKNCNDIENQSWSEEKLENVVIDLMSPLPLKPQHRLEADKQSDLIQSAKNLEFEEVKAQKNKHNHLKPNAKKTEKESSLSYIDRRVQNPLLHVESTTISSPENSKLGPEEKLSQSDSKLDNVVIDLLSPLPPKSRKILEANKQQQKASDQVLVDVVDLSDSEDDKSPEHVRKANELRAFLACIKD